MCAVPVKGGRALANEVVELNLNAKTINWLFGLYPEAKESHAITDYVFKQIDHSMTDEKMFMCEQFSGDSGLAPEWEIFRDVDIGGKLDLNKFVELIERQQIELDIKVDLSGLQKRLHAMSGEDDAKSFPNLNKVTVQVKTLEEMAVKREQFKAKRREITNKRRVRVLADAEAGDPQVLAVIEGWRKTGKSN
ncbi:hypothetical protein LTR17_022928 [Elasticomyces elasticus]|nr:hypothetical protein LTR17_022928 [Elasticomyces elasticus]